MLTARLPAFRRLLATDQDHGTAAARMVARDGDAATVARTLLAGASLLALVCCGQSAAACSICLAGDPSFSSQGASAQQAGDVSLYLELRGWEKRSGLLAHDDEHGGGEEHEVEHDHGTTSDDHHHDDEHADDSEGVERNESQRLDLYASWTPIDRLTLAIDVPWAFNSIVEQEPGGSTHTQLNGLGDVSLLASGVVWRNREALPSTWVELRGLVKAPTGRDEDRVDGGLDPHLQAGTGSWDFGVGAAAVHRLAWGAIYASALGRWNQEGALDYEYGDIVLANLALEADAGHLLGSSALQGVAPGVELNFRYAGYDEQRETSYADSGGSILYATPFVRARIPGLSQRLWLRAAAQLPLTSRWLHGTQREEPVWSIGLGVGF